MARFQRHVTMSSAALQEHIAGKKAHQRKMVRRAVRICLSGVLAVCMLAFGYLTTETLLRISETPLPVQAGPTAAATTQPPTTARPRPAGPPLHTFYVPLQLLDNREQAKEFMAQIAEQEANTAVLLFKDSGGYLSYKSHLMQQSRLRASQRTRYRTDWAIYDLKNKAKVKIIAVVHCFDDPLAASLIPEAAVRLRETAATPWKDAQGRSWLNPYAESAREYLLAVLREILAFGAGGARVDEILLCGVQFPAGNLQAAVFPGEEPVVDPVKIAAQRNAVLREFLEKAKAIAGKTTLSCMISQQAAQEGAPEYGGALWDSAADSYAVDMRGAPWSQQEAFWALQPVAPVVAPGDDHGAQDYIVLQDEVLPARY